MRLIYCLLLAVVCSAWQRVEATEVPSFEFIFDKATPVLKSQNGDIRGKLEERKGIYSQWNFPGKVVEIIVNDKTQKILDTKIKNEAGGPFLMNASPYPNDYVIFYYGTGPGGNNFEVRNAAGKIVFKDNYYDNNDIVWVNENYIIYSQAEENDQATPLELRECRESTGGDSFIIHWQGYDLKTKDKKRLNIPTYVTCGP